MKNIQTVNELIALLQNVRHEIGGDTQIKFWEEGIDSQIPDDDDYITNSISAAILRGQKDLMDSNSKINESATLYLRLSH